MSFYDDQEDDWFASGCKGSPDNYDGAGNFVPDEMGAPYTPTPKRLTRSQKRKLQRKRAGSIVKTEGKEAHNE